MTSRDVILNSDIAVAFTHLPIFDSAMGVINNRYSVIHVYLPPF